jgi:hypothetical protein
MRSKDIRSDAFKRLNTMLRPVLKSAPWICGLVCLAVLVSIPFSALVSQAQQSGEPPTGPRDPSGLPPINPLANRTADPNRILVDSMKHQDLEKRFRELNQLRQKEMTADTAKLLALATELNTKTEKSVNDKLTMEAVRQVEQIEKLAHSVRDKMKATVSN